MSAERKKYPAKIVMLVLAVLGSLHQVAMLEHGGQREVVGASIDRSHWKSRDDEV
jgi:hypothetical protein